MNESEVRRLMPPDDGLPADRHNLIKERVMASIRPDREADRQEAVRPRRMLRRLVPGLASVLVLLAAGTATGAALGLFPWQDREILDEAGCRNPDSVEQLVAQAETPDGGTHQFWITRTDAEAPPNGHILVELDADGNYVGSAVGCNFVWEDPTEYYGSLWVVVPSTISDEGALASVMGHVPAEAAASVVTFSDGTSTQIEVQTDGYFLGLVVRPGIRADANFPEPVHIAAVDASGGVIAEQDLA